MIAQVVDDPAAIDNTFPVSPLTGESTHARSTALVVPRSPLSFEPTQLTCAPPVCTMQQWLTPHAILLTPVSGDDEENPIWSTKSIAPDVVMPSPALAYTIAEDGSARGHDARIATL
jgi:hypothetical protein